MPADRSYKDDEVRAIIDRALKTQPDGGVSHEDLLAIGAGVGLSPAALESAASEVREERLNQAASAQVVAKRRRAVLAHAFVFLAVNAFLFAINFLTTPGQWWVLFSVFGWGLGLLLHAGFGLSKTVTPARMNRERRRLDKRRLTGSARKRLATQGGGVRVATERDERDEPDEPDERARQRDAGDR